MITLPDSDSSSFVTVQIQVSVRVPGTNYVQYICRIVLPWEGVLLFFYASSVEVFTTCQLSNNMF